MGLPFAMLTRLWSRLDGSLRARILVPTSVFFAVTLAVMIAAAVQLYGVEIDRTALERVELATNVIAEGLAEAFQGGQVTDVPEMLAAVQEHRPDLAWIAVMDADGKVRFSTRAELIGTKRWVSASLAVRPLTIPGRPGQFAALRPLLPAKCGTCAPLGWVELRFSRAAQAQARRKLARTLVMVGLPSWCLLLAIAWWLLGREAIGPLRRLVKAMGAAERGALESRADEGRPDELGVAARGFDAVLSALRKSQAELESVYRERMERADRFAVVGEMATGLAHEIKNPLAGLSGALELLAEDLRASPTHGEVVTEMRNQVTRLTRIMESLLGFARPPRARMVPTDLNAVVEKALFLIEQQRQGGSKLAVLRSLEPDLPWVKADSGQLEQVILNICLNACQAMNGSGGTLQVKTAVRGEGILVEISDSGPGIPVEARPHIFKPFYTTRPNGNGLGLSISERIVNDHGGRIAFTCPPGGGTTFSIILPRQGLTRGAA